MVRRESIRSFLRLRWTAPAGDTWKKVDNHTGSNLVAFAVVSEQEAWAVGYEIIHLTGGVWKTAPRPGTVFLNGVFIAADASGCAVG